MHLDLGYAIALAGFATATFNIKTKAPGVIAPRASFLSTGKQLAHRCEDTCVGGRVRAGSAANRTLVDIYTLVQMAKAGNLSMGCWL